MHRIGLTGGIACGKSTVSDFLKELGIPVVDADKLARVAVRPGSAGLEAIRNTFGDSLLQHDGTLDREERGRVIFDEERKRAALNDILHPAIWHEAEKEMLAFQETGRRLVVLDVPLLIEMAWNLRMNDIWVVKSTEEQQIRRLCKRSGYSREAAAKRIAGQMPTRNKLNYADEIIDNSGTVEQTKTQVKHALMRVRNRIIQTEDV